MAIETRTTSADAHAALNDIERMARPGQTLDIHEAIDLICDIYNRCRSARTVETFETTQARQIRLNT